MINRNPKIKIQSKKNSFFIFQHFFILLFLFALANCKLLICWHFGHIVLVAKFRNLLSQID